MFHHERKEPDLFGAVVSGTKYKAWFARIQIEDPHTRLNFSSRFHETTPLPAIVFDLLIHPSSTS